MKASGALRALTIAMVAGASLSLSACGVPDAKARGELVAETYFAALRAGRLDEALALFGTGFFRVTPREKIVTILGDLHARCGAQKSHTLAAWRATAGLGGTPSNALLEYSVSYAACSTREDLTIQEDADGSWKILALNVVFTSEPADRQNPPTTST